MPTLVPGALAPSFSLEALDGQHVALEALRGRRVLLSFLRNAQCAVCNLWVHETSTRAKEWSREGLEVLAIFESSAERLRTQFAQRRPCFPVLADPGGELHDAYGSRTAPERVAEVIERGLGAATLARAAACGFPTVMEEGSNFFRLPAEVLVDEHGVVARVHVAQDVVSHLPPEEILAFARRSRA